MKRISFLLILTLVFSFLGSAHQDRLISHYLTITDSNWTISLKVPTDVMKDAVVTHNPEAQALDMNGDSFKYFVEGYINRFLTVEYKERKRLKLLNARFDETEGEIELRILNLAPEATKIKVTDSLYFNTPIEWDHEWHLDAGEFKETIYLNRETTSKIFFLVEEGPRSTWRTVLSILGLLIAVGFVVWLMRFN